MQKLASTVRTLDWWRVVRAAAWIVSLTVALVLLAVYLYVLAYQLLGEGDPDRLAAFASFAGTQGAPTFFVVLAIVFAWRTALKASESPIVHGVAVGVSAAAAAQLVIYLAYPPVNPREALIYLTLGIAGGCTGGALGLRTLARQEAVYRASRGIGQATDANDIASAIGEHLAGPDVSAVTLWRSPNESGPDSPLGGSAHTFELWSSWAPRADEAWPSGASLDASALPEPARLVRDGWAWLRAEELPDAGRALWSARGARSALLVALADGTRRAPFGLLMVLFRKKRRPLARGVVREYLTVAAQAALARRLGVLQERQRVARDLHDTLVQDFIAIEMNLAAIDVAQLSEAARRRVEICRRTARAGGEEGRRLMRADELDTIGGRRFPEALESRAKRWSEETGVRAHFSSVGEPRPVPPQAHLALLKAVREALSNVRRHANASRVELTLAFAEGFVSLEIKDDGMGFDPAAANGGPGAHPAASGVNPHPRGDSGGFGLRAMRERVEELGGSLFVLSAPGQGTRLLLKVPSGPEKNIHALEEGL